MDTFSEDIVIRGRKIRSDVERRVSLNDIHAAAGFEKNRRPHDWIRLPSTSRLIEAVLAKITGKSRLWSKNEIRSVYYTLAGNNGGTFADPRVALAYAEYLNPKLAVEVREVFLRYKAADPTLADEVLQRASPEANEWAGARAIGRAERNMFTRTLQGHGVSGRGFADSTNAIYRSLFDADAKGLRAKKGVTKKSVPLRDHMETKELLFVGAAEHLAGERIEEIDCRGNSECATASMKSASFIRKAIEADRADRAQYRPR
jgi:KilA-N domain